MAVSRLDVKAKAMLYKFTSEEYERNGETRTIHRAIIDQNDKMFTLNVREEDAARFAATVPKFSDVELTLEYVDSGNGAYLSVRDIVAVGAPQAVPAAKPQDGKTK